MPLLGAGIGAIGSIGSGIIGGLASSSKYGMAEQDIQDQLKDLANIGVPTADAMKVVLQRYQSAGKLTPELEQTIQQAGTSFDNINTDPAYGAYQQKSLAALQSIADSGGETLQDKANLEKTMGDINAQERGNREAITSNFRSKGQLGSGLELASQLSNQQNAAQNANSYGLQNAATAQQRALDAIAKGGSEAQSMQGQEFNQKAQVASAQDAIKNWNAQNTAATQARNVASSNAAQQSNLANAQNLSNANTDTANKQTMYNSQLTQQQYEDQLQKDQAQGAARGQAVTVATNQGNNIANSLGNVGSGLTKIGTSLIKNNDDEQQA